MPLHPYCTGVVGIGTFWHIVFVTDGAPQPSQLINHCNYRSTIAATSTDQPLQLPTNYCNYLSTLASTDQPLKPPINHCNYWSTIHWSRGAIPKTSSDPMGFGYLKTI